MSKQIFSIENGKEYELVIKKSKFISISKRLNSVIEFDNFILELKNEYKKATHFCYAYVLGCPSIEKCFDDKEPSGTAGKPILNVIKKNNLSNVAMVVVRYFGGIKLGAGGLVRAYSKCASENVKLCKRFEILHS